MPDQRWRIFEYEPPQTPLAVIHADDDILVLSKPYGLLSVPGRPAEHRDCIESRARQVYPAARIVHRLDMSTSGLIVLAMNAMAHKHLGLQFERRQTKKTYIARVWGEVEGEQGEVDLPLICDWPNRPKQMVDHENGRPSQTKWEVLEREDGITRVALYPMTGRSHQLRVHMLAIGHPILGDEFYAPEDAFRAAERLQLHAQELHIRHPFDARLCSFKDDPPF